ncbi:alpha/beta-hydrolase [Pholiota conissans]|uniref:Alpha/beta-hydrolase n=1 Tax=Pholiota conissans TaxID=109636 RepID=A0A9P5ZE94_9AGAR|nr:alpha/beta-hydrolase [Pholiota conissans]
MSPWFLASRRLQPPQVQPTQRSPTQSLLHYETGSPPPSARVDPKLKLQPRRPLHLWDYLKFGVIVVSKATELTSDVLSHHIWGPRRKSWGIEMTIVTSLIRGTERHSAMVDIGTIRMLMGIGGLVPLPSDALVSPVTFRVKKRSLRGILAKYDAQESGQRELCGEWVVGLKTWQRMQTEWKTAKRSDPTSSQSSFSSPGGSTTPPADFLKRKERVILYIHGGAYYLSSAAAQRIISIPLAKYTDSRVFALDYRLAPETCFPGPLHDAVTAYMRLTEELHIPPENIIVSGDSAGGGLALALLMYLRDNEYSLPSGAILMSPWVDLTMSSESWDSNAQYDVVPFPTADNHMNPIALYLGEHTEEYLTHPYASPLFGDFKGLPPLLVQAGDAEVLRDEIALLAHKATLAGVQVMHELYEDAIHVFQAYPFLEASRRSFESMREFVRYVLPQYQSRSPQLLAAIAERGMEQEITNDRSVLVGGDGVEAPLDYDTVKKYGSRKRGTVNKGDFTNMSDDSDDEPSWVRSPALRSHKDLPSWASESKHMDTGEFEQVKDADWQDIPHLNLTPPSLCSPIPLRVNPESPIAMRPSLSTASSSSSIRSASSFSCPKSPDFPVTPVSASPRRIQSANSLSGFALHLQCGHDEPASTPHGLSFNLFKSSTMTQSLSRSTATLISPEPFLTIPTSRTESMALPPPSLRKRRLSSGLLMSHKIKKGRNIPSLWLTENDGRHDTTAMNVASSSTSSGVGDVKTLVEEWHSLGPANKTVMVSVSPISPTMQR